MRGSQLISRIGIALTAGALVAVSPATAGLAASNKTSHAVIASTARATSVSNGTSGKSRAVPAGVYDNCLYGYLIDGGYCVYSSSRYYPCMAVNYSVLNWGSCRNKDEAFADIEDAAGGCCAVRLYYSPDWQGAWACVDIGWYSNDLNQEAYTFDNGPGRLGYGQEIWENVASSQIVEGTSKCSNPLPEDG